MTSPCHTDLKCTSYLSVFLNRRAPVTLHTQRKRSGWSGSRAIPPLRGRGIGNMERALVLLLLAGCIPSLARADGHILIRLSVKVIVNVFEELPSGFDDDDVVAAIDAANQQMDAHGRGYRFVLVEPVIQIGGGASGRPLPSTYFNPEFSINEYKRDEMEEDALANPGLYAWNSSAVNIFINNDSLPLCPRTSDKLIALPVHRGSRAMSYGHTVGHLMDLCHVAGCECAFCCETGETGTCHTSPGNDGMSDTLPNVTCWDQDEIAQHNFGLDYAQLSAPQQSQVDDVYLNLLNNRIDCHGGVFNPIVRLTERQLDHWADTASVTLLGVCDGQTFFVDAAFNGFETGRSSNPFNRVAEGLHEADGGGDIVLIRGGNYFENLTLSTPVTLRAPRGNTARVGG